jgi:predicted nucleotidyltransferase
VLARVLAPVADNIIVAFVYGSVAKGSERATSDIDLMIVANHLNYTELVGLLLPAKEILKRPINPTVYTQAEFENKLKQGSHFLKKVMAQEKIPIIGDLDKDGAVK